MDYLNLAASIGLAMAALGLNLIILSRALLISNDRLPMFGRTVKRCSYGLLALGVLLTIVGVLVPGYIISFISVGVMLILLAIALIAQGEALLSSQSALAKLGQKLKIYAWIYTIIGFIAVVVVGVVSVCLLFCFC